MPWSGSWALPIASVPPRNRLASQEPTMHGPAATSGRYRVVRVIAPLIGEVEDRAKLDFGSAAFADAAADDAFD
jgi:hypothetical protein